MGRLSPLSIGPGLLVFDLTLAAVGLAVAVDASLLEGAVMAVAIVCAGLAAQAARVAILARRRVTSLVPSAILRRGDARSSVDAPPEEI